MTQAKHQHRPITLTKNRMCADGKKIGCDLGRCRRRKSGSGRAAAAPPTGACCRSRASQRWSCSRCRCTARPMPPPLILVESQPRTHRPRAVHVVPELRRQKSLRDTESSCQARAFQEKDQRRPCVPSLCRRLGWHR
jgi:hypothetical protein